MIRRCCDYSIFFSFFILLLLRLPRITLQTATEAFELDFFSVATLYLGWALLISHSSFVSSLSFQALCCPGSSVCALHSHYCLFSLVTGVGQLVPSYSLLGILYGCLFSPASVISSLSATECLIFSPPFPNGQACLVATQATKAWFFLLLHRHSCDH